MAPRRSASRHGAWAALAATLVAAPAVAHDFWLQPDRFEVAPGATTPFTLQVGHGPQRQRSAIPLRRITRFSAVAPDGSRLDLRPALHPGAPAEDGHIRLPVAGTYVIALQSDSGAQSHLPADRFDAYLREEGLTPALDARRREGRLQADGSERYSRVAKALVQVGAGGGMVTRPLGLPLEIVPLVNPYAADRPTRLPIMVLYQGRPLAGALVKLTDLAHDAEPVETQRTGPDGRTAFQLPQVGEWLLNVVWTRSLPRSEEVDFETVFSSLCFRF